MNTPNGTYNSFRLEQFGVRPAPSPDDALMVVRPATGTSGTVSVPFVEDTEVEYIITRTAKVTKDANGKTIVAFNAATDSIGRILILGKAQGLQTNGVPL